jgi:hypothetical protein
MPEKEIGYVTHYFGHLSVAVIKLSKGDLSVGETIHVKGHTSDLIQAIDSMQVDHKPVQKAKPKDDFAIKIKDKVREGDTVFKVTP